MKKQKRKKIVAPVLPTTEAPVGLDRALHLSVRLIAGILKYLSIFILGGIVASVLTLILCSGAYLRRISATSGLSVNQILQITTTMRAEVNESHTPQTILVLGTDALANRDEVSKLTDTILLVTVDPKQGKISTISFPRDLWIASQSSKVNGIYQRGMPTMQQVMHGISGRSIDNTVVIDIKTVGTMIDALGGLDVQIERSFVDYRFPRADVDVRVERDPAKLYETVAFTKGLEHMSGDRAIRFIRSRHSPDVIEGSDDARVRRQQLVIAALIAKVQDPMLLRNPEQIGAILKIYQHDIASSVSLESGAQTAWQFVKAGKRPHIQSYQFPIKEVDPNGLITHPNRFPGGAWVYLPVDPTYTQIQKTIQTWIEK